MQTLTINHLQLIGAILAVAFAALGNEHWACCHWQRGQLQCFFCVCRGGGRLRFKKLDQQNADAKESNRIQCFFSLLPYSNWPQSSYRVMFFSVGSRIRLSPAWSMVMRGKSWRRPEDEGFTGRNLENQWLEYDIFFWDGLFSGGKPGKLSVSVW